MLRFYLSIIFNLHNGPSYMIRMRRMARHPEKYSMELRYRYALNIVKHFMTAVDTKTLVYGIENLPKEGGYVMFPNHQGKYDVLGIFYSHKTPCSFVMDKAKSYSYFLRELINLIDAKRLALDDVKQNIAVINEVSEAVANGEKYIIFPEGGYKKNHNHLQEFKPGSFKCATKAKAPIVPVCLIDSYKALNSNHIGRVTTKVIYLEPLYYDNYKNLKTTQHC